MIRGYSCVALDNIKDRNNVGGALRASHVYGVDLLVLAGRRYSHVPADTTKAERSIPLLEVDDVFDVIPRNCVPVAVDLIEGAIPLPKYQHPERAFYIFGAEDQTLGKRITDRCRDVIYVPTQFCMNLAATVNVILYDRLCKRQEWLVPHKWESAKAAE